MPPGIGYGDLAPQFQNQLAQQFQGMDPRQQNVAQRLYQGGGGINPALSSLLGFQGAMPGFEHLNQGAQGGLADYYNQQSPLAQMGLQGAYGAQGLPGVQGFMGGGGGGGMQGALGGGGGMNPMLQQLMPLLQMLGMGGMGGQMGGGGGFSPMIGLNGGGMGAQGQGSAIPPPPPQMPTNPALINRMGGGGFPQQGQAYARPQMGMAPTPGMGGGGIRPQMPLLGMGQQPQPGRF